LIKEKKWLNKNRVKMTIIDQLDPIFKPKSVAIIGASSNPLKLNNWITVSALKSKFEGKTYLVNPHVKEIQGVKTFSSVLEVPADIDLAAIMVPANLVPDVMKECIAKKVRGAIIFSAGYKEIGEKGIEREKEINELARKGNFRIVGPNCMGIYSSAVNLNLTALSAKKGEVAFVSQSGGYGLEIFATAMQNGITFSKFISTGDKADVKDHEYLDYLNNDPDTKVIVLYLEGIENGREFYNVAKRITKKKPIFAIKIGRSEIGRVAAQSHTGALAGEEEVYTAAFKQAGIIRAYDIEELFDYLRAYLTQPLPKGNGVGILVGSGGVGVAAADKCAELGLKVPPLSKENQEILKAILPEFASFRNPVDFTGSGAEKLFSNWGDVREIFNDRNIDSWFFSFPGSGFSGIKDIVKSYEPLMEGLQGLTSAEIFGRNDAPFIAAGNERDETIKPLLEKLLGLLFYPTPERAIRAIAALNNYREFLEEDKLVEKPFELKGDARVGEVIITNALKQHRRNLTEIESKQILSAYQIPTTDVSLARNKEEAVKYAKKIGFPVVLKIVSPEITHKSDAGGVKPNLENEKQVIDAFNQIIENAKRYNPKASVLGVAIQKMVSQGIEVIIGIKRDPQFGPVIMFGVGGILVELFKDISLRLVPISKRDAEKMIDEIKLHRLLEGYRFYKPVDKNALISILTKISALAQHFLSIEEMDLNPVFLYPDGAVVVDARIIIEKSEVK
jgi:acyl-CoA synthetase (NDP forming)